MTRWVAFVSVGVVPVREFLCFGAKLTQRACTRDIPRKRTREGRSQSRREGVGQEKWTEQTSREMSRAENRPIDRIDRSGEADGRERAVEMPGSPTRENESIFLVALWEFGSSIWSPWLTETQNARKVSQTSPFFHLELTPARDVLLFFHPLGTILCVGKEM